MMKKIKILITGPSGSIHLKRWIDKIRDSDDYEPVYVSIRDKWDPGIKTYFIPFYSFLPYKVNLLISYIRFRFITVKEQPDIAHFHFLAPFSLMAAGFNYPYIVSLWGSDASYYYGESSGIIRYLYDYSIKHASYLFTAGNHLLNFLNAENSKTANITWGVNIERRKTKRECRESFDIGHGSFIILCIRGMRDIFQIERIIDAVEISKSMITDIGLILIEGPDPVYNDKIRNMAAHLDYVRIIKPLDNIDFRKLICSADIALSLAIRDARPVSVKEAMAEGIPVIYQNIEGIEETINNFSGIGLKTHEAGELADAIKTLYADEKKRETMSEYAKAYAEKYHDEKLQWDKVFRIYREIVKDGR